MVPVTAAISTAKFALRKLSAAAPYEISAAHWANSAGANARLSTTESAAADAHTPSRATDTHAAATAVHTATAAADMHATSTTVHATSTTVHATSTTVHTASPAAAPLGEGRGCNC
jgi:hypothetical protein